MNSARPNLIARGIAPLPAGYELAAIPDPSWQLLTGKACRRLVRGKGCGQPSVAARLSGQLRPEWRAYCTDHLDGRWIEDGQVKHWVLRQNRNPDDAGQAPR